MLICVLGLKLGLRSKGTTQTEGRHGVLQDVTPCSNVSDEPTYGEGESRLNRNVGTSAKHVALTPGAVHERAETDVEGRHNL
jgi:hypothetical protein